LVPDDLLDRERFVEIVVDHVRTPAVLDTVKVFTNPPGRTPSPELVEMSGWLGRLSPVDWQHVIRAMAHAVDDALFGVMCLLDGVRSINPRPGVVQRLELHAVLEDGRRRQLNVEGDGEELHDLYGFLSRERGVPTAEVG
jgi:hypothetical protein